MFLTGYRSLPFPPLRITAEKVRPAAIIPTFQGRRTSTSFIIGAPDDPTGNADEPPVDLGALMQEALHRIQYSLDL
jgi:hypothetical protein